MGRKVRPRTKKEFPVAIDIAPREDLGPNLKILKPETQKEMHERMVQAGFGDFLDGLKELRPHGAVFYHET